MSSQQEKEYLLGANERELERLRFQHSVWKPLTERLFDRLKVGRGWHCLDVGGGPGFVAFDLYERIGNEGSVTIVEPSSFYREYVESVIREKALTQLEFLHGTAETVSLPAERYDLVFVRWVLSFIPEPQAFLANILRSLKPGGIIAVQDYYYEGLSLFPHGTFNGVADVMRSYYRSNGGDAYVAGRLPSLFKSLGVNMVEYSPNCLAGGPQSGVTEWAGQFFTMHLPIMAEKGVISAQQRDAFLNDWNEKRSNPDMMFHSPIVVDIAGVKN